MKIWKKGIVVLFALLLTVSSSVHAKSPEEMAGDLNESLYNYDWDQFGKKIGEYLSKDKRFGNQDFGKIGKQAADSVKGFEAFGPYVSHTIVRNDACGERLKRMVIVVFARDAQYFITYWFSKPKEMWALSKFSTNGQSNTGKFFEKLDSQLSIRC